MALTIQVSKKSVDLLMPKLWTVTLNLTCLDGGEEVINQDFSKRYRTGQDLADLEAKYQKDMQKTIDDYKAEQVIFNHAKLDMAVINLNINLEG